MGKVIGICSGKGGTTKSQTTQELGYSLKNDGKKVLLIDLDPQCDLSKNCDAKIENTIDDIFQQKCKITDGIQHLEYYDIIPGSPNLVKADITYRERDDIYLLSDVCQILSQYYDYILIDNQPARSLIVNMTYIACDYIIAATLADDRSLEGVINIENDLRKLRESRNKESHAYIIGIILSLFDKRTTAHKLANKELIRIAEKLDGDVFVEKVRSSTVAIQARRFKVPVQAYERFNNISLDYKRITKEIRKVCE